MKQLLPLLILLFLSGKSQAQEYHFVFFADKDPALHGAPINFLSQRALNRREKQGIAISDRDYPVTPEYLDSLVARGAKVKYSSRWFNAALIEANSEIIASIQDLPFVNQNSPLSRLKGGTRVNAVATSPLAPQKSERRQTEAYDYGAAQGQNALHAINSMHTEGFDGEGIGIAVIDAGFSKVDQLPVFQDLMNSGRLKGTYDFVTNNEHVFAQMAGESSVDDTHGTKVLSVLAAFQEGQMVGTAPKADYWLLKSEDIAFELPLEEIYWAVAAEYADSVGADIINTSLGYFDFDKPQYNYAQEDFDGDQIWITQAADYAASTGMLVVTSAGNQGNRAWGYLTAPSDADSILAVGGVYEEGSHWPVSSYGPTADGRMKPNVCGQGVNVAIASTSGNITSGSGTSYAAPLLSGLAAGLWQAYPNLSNMELLQLIEQSGSNADNPRNEVGHGVPNYTRASAIMRALSRDDEALALLESISINPNPSQNGKIHFQLPNEMVGEEYEVVITDLSGKVVHTGNAKAISSSQTLKLPQSANNGAYIMSIRTKGAQKTLKLLLDK